MPALLAPQPYQIVIARFRTMLHFELLRKYMEPMTNFFGMCASINDKNCNYRPCKSFITQNNLLNYIKKHREKNSQHRENSRKIRGIWSRLECGHPVHPACGTPLAVTRDDFLVFTLILPYYRHGDDFALRLWLLFVGTSFDEIICIAY